MSRGPRKQAGGFDFTWLRQQLKDGNVEPLYLFEGEEAYLQKRAVNLLLSTIEESARAFNQAVFSLADAGTRQGSPAIAAIDNANQLPMMAARRIVVIRDFEKIKEADLETVIEYLKRPMPTTSVVFQTGQLDQRRKITAALIKACRRITFDRPGTAQAAKFAKEYLRKRGSMIADQDLSRLIGLTGTSLYFLENELNKLATYSGGGMIGSTDIDLLSPRWLEQSSFDLSDAIMERNPKKALRVATRLMDDGSDPVLLVGTLGGIYRRMLATKELIARRADQAEVSRATGKRGEYAEKFIQHLSRIPAESILNGIRRIARADDAIKNSEGTPRLQIEYLVAELTLPTPKR